jgi:pyridoxal phosphate enzyme (YggS family)
MRLSDIQAKMARAAEQAGCAADAVTLVAVSKTKPVAAIEPVIALGHCVFGENRVQEAAAKWPQLRAFAAKYAPKEAKDIELHLIGPLQTNKVEEAVALFDVIETLDRPKLAAALARARDRQPDAPFPRLYVQVNTGEEPQKSGIAPHELADFLQLCRESYDLQPEGLMCLPPVDDAPAPHFALLRKLADTHGLAHCSMGMSGDFETAIHQGASHIRLGTQIFGPRD